jgi:uncharacterized protein YlzI (FlbEa/FlbD family)
MPQLCVNKLENGKKVVVKVKIETWNQNSYRYR